MIIENNTVETEFKSSVPIRGKCHEDFQEVAETFEQKRKALVFPFLFKSF